MNKLLVVEDIKNVEGGDYNLEYTQNTELNIIDKVQLDNYDKNNYNIKINLDNESSFEFNKVNFINKDMIMEINIYDNSMVNLNWTIINEGRNRVNITVNMLGNNSKSEAKVRVINKTSDSNIDIVFKGIIKESTIDNEMLEDLKGLIIGDDTIKISPIMEVGTNEVMANHLVTLGSFNKEELFYLNSKGLTSEAAKRLLVESFICGIMPDNLREKLKMEVINYE